MKELSIEEKAKRYDEAIKVARQYYNDKVMPIGTDFKLEKMFPELAESEDEKIRREIIDYFSTADDKELIPYESWIAWLEKQGDKDEEILILKDQIESLHAAIKAIKETHKIELEKKGEQKLTNKVEPKFKDGDWVVYKDTVWKVCNISLLNYYELLKINNEVSTRFIKDVDETAHLWTIQDSKDGDVLVYDNGCVEIILLFKKWLHEVGKGAYSYAHITSSGHYIHINNWSDCGLSAHPATKEQRDLLFQKMKEEGYEWDAEKKELKKIEQKPTNNVIEEEKPLLEKFKQAVYDCAWGKVTCKKEGETKEEYANRWAEHFLLIVRDWADDYIDFTIQQKLRNSYEKGKTDIIEKQGEQTPTKDVCDTCDEKASCVNPCPIKLVEQNPVWGEEDEKIKETIITGLEMLKDGASSKSLIALYNKKIAWLKSLKDRVQPKPKQEWSEEDEPQKELAETYLAVFDKKFPILPTLKGKQLADYKNFLNKCQQILGLKYWGLRPLQTKLFEKLSLLWAAWGAEHLKGLGQTDGDTDNEKQEWSEEDDKKRKGLIKGLEDRMGFGWASDPFSREEYIDWLKSLKDRVQPRQEL